MKTVHRRIANALLAIALAAALAPRNSAAEIGQLKWTFNAGGAVSSCAAIGLDGTVYIASGKLYALDGATGAQLWASTAAGFFSPIAGPDGTIYVRADGGRVHALDGATGAQKWSCTAGGSSFLALGTDGTVYGSDEQGNVYALNGVAGTTKWAVSTKGDLAVCCYHGAPAIGADGTVYVGPITSLHLYAGWPIGATVYALDSATGKTKWAGDAGVLGGDGFLAIGADGTVYTKGCVGDPYDCTMTLYALDGATGAQKWSFATGGGLSPAVIGDDGTVYLGSSGSDGSTFYALNGTTGSLKWSSAIGSAIRCTPALAADGTVYLGTSDGKVWALDGASGSPQWTFGDAGEICSLAIASDGTVFAGSTNGKVYAVQGSAGLANGAWPKFQHDAQNTGALPCPGCGRPVIQTQPVGGRFVEGSRAVLCVEATGTAPLSYQWFFANAPLPSATDSLLTLPKLQFSDMGDYYVEVSNQVGVVTSSVARVTVGFGLTVTNKGVGTVQVSPPLAAYDPGSSVELRAVPTGARQFVRWSGDASGAANPLVLTITGHVRVVAEFSSLPGDKFGPLYGAVLAGRSAPGFADGPGLTAQFASITALDIGPQDRLYVADAGNHRIRVVDTAGGVTTLAGTGEDAQRDGPGREAAFHDLRALSVDGAGNCYLLDGDQLRRVGADGSVCTLETIVIPYFYPPPAGDMFLHFSGAISSLVVSRSGEVYLLVKAASCLSMEYLILSNTTNRVYHGMDNARHIEVNATYNYHATWNRFDATRLETYGGETLQAIARGAAEELIVYREKVASPTWLQTAEFLGRTPPLILTGTNVSPAGMIPLTLDSVLMHGNGKFYFLSPGSPPILVPLDRSPQIGLAADGYGLLYSATANQVLRFVPASTVVLSLRPQGSIAGTALLSILSPPGRQVRLEQSSDFGQWETRQTLTSTGQDTVELTVESDDRFFRAVLLP
jgi:outer membrane protein assembly factor BamB